MATLGLLAGLCFSSRAFAQSPARFDPPPRGEPALWRADWPTFSWLEAAGTVSAGTATLVLALNPPPLEPRWRGGILFDDAVRAHLRLDSASARSTARSVGDWPYFTAAALPLLADPLVALLGFHDGKAAANLEMMGLEAFSYAGLLSFVSTRISVRERPDTTECLREHPDGVVCERDTEAFWSGHTSIVAASAGLVCANHHFMPLWGSKLADGAACVLATSGATVTAVSRLMADRHYASDVLVGMGIGFAFGYGVPVLLHYGRRTSPPFTLAIQPQSGGGLVTVAGLL